MKKIKDYIPVVGEETIAAIEQKANRLKGKKIVHVNSTYQGGGVAEMLQVLVPLMNDVGLMTGWRIFHGNPDFFGLTKQIHNSLQGENIGWDEIKESTYIQASEDYSVYTHFHHDCVIVHDPQPLPMINHYFKRQPWVWRCHVDLSHPDEHVWSYLKQFVHKYDRMIVSHQDYLKQDVNVEQKIIYPAIDPLSPKNHDLSEEEIKRLLDRYQISVDKPLVVQISRFDKWKDPLGVFRIFQKIRQNMDCRLVLCGSMAADDPEGIVIYVHIVQQARDLIEQGDVILLTAQSDLLVNALQRQAAVVIQKSLREGFGLTVTEAMWKQKPVVASDVGGIPLQIQDGETGFLVDPQDEDTFAHRALQIMQNPEQSAHIAQKARARVLQDFLITRLLGNYLDLLDELIG